MIKTAKKSKSSTSPKKPVATAAKIRATQVSAPLRNISVIPMEVHDPENFKVKLNSAPAAENGLTIPARLQAHAIALASIRESVRELQEHADVRDVPGNLSEWLEEAQEGRIYLPRVLGHDGQSYIDWRELLAHANLASTMTVVSDKKLVGRAVRIADWEAAFNPADGEKRDMPESYISIGKTVKVNSVGEGTFLIVPLVEVSLGWNEKRDILEAAIGNLIDSRGSALLSLAARTIQTKAGELARRFNFFA